MRRIKVLALHGMSKDAWKWFDDEGYKHYYVVEKRFGWKPEDYPNAIRIGRQTASLPLSAKPNEQDMSDVISAVWKTIIR